MMTAPSSRAVGQQLQAWRWLLPALFNDTKMARNPLYRDMLASLDKGGLSHV